MVPDPLVTCPVAYAIRFPVLSKTRKLTMYCPPLGAEVFGPAVSAKRIQKWHGVKVTVPGVETVWAMHCPDIYAVGFSVPVDVIWSMRTDEMLPTNPPGNGSFMLSPDSVTLPVGNPVFALHPAFTFTVTFPVNPPETRLGMLISGAPLEMTLTELATLLQT
jgi:hypothetical protein